MSCVALIMAAAAAFDFDLDGDMVPPPAKLDNVDARPPKTLSGPPESKGLELRVTAGFMHPCDCCGQEEKVKGSRFGAECKRALNNVTNREKKEGAQDPERRKRWEAIKKEGGAALNALLLSYRNQCPDAGGRGKKRGSIDMIRTLETWSNEDTTSAGQRLHLMPLSRWLRIAQTDRALSVAEAQNQWNEKMTKYQQGTLHHKFWKKEGDAVWLAMPVEDYVDEGNTQRHSGILEAQHQKKAKPGQSDLEEAAKTLGLEQVPLQIAYGSVGSAPKTPPRGRRSSQCSMDDPMSAEKPNPPPNEQDNKKRPPFHCMLVTVG